MTEQYTIALPTNEAVETYQNRNFPFYRFILQLEHAVDLAESSHAAYADEFRAIWGELEILNALNSSEGTALDDEEIAKIIDEIQLFVNF